MVRTLDINSGLSFLFSEMFLITKAAGPQRSHRESCRS